MLDLEHAYVPLCEWWTGSLAGCAEATGAGQIVIMNCPCPTSVTLRKFPYAARVLDSGNLAADARRSCSATRS
jgi:hypothetical protein